VGWSRSNGHQYGRELGLNNRGTCQQELAGRYGLVGVVIDVTTEEGDVVWVVAMSGRPGHATGP
jgi:hypothetical protein